ncbi:coiled-coil domain-containing protein 42 homolog isoform X2 [Watersipora subatra]
MERRDALKAMLDKLRNYAQFLEQLLKSSEEFNEVRDIVSRYETLRQTHKELYSKEESSHAIGESQRQQLSRYVARKDAEILSLTNRLSELQLELEVLLVRSERLDNQMTHIENTAANKTLELGRIRMSTYAMFHLMLRQSSRMSSHNFNDITDPVDQLDMICTYIVDLTHILDDIKKSGIHGQLSNTTLRKYQACE